MKKEQKYSIVEKKQCFSYIRFSSLKQAKGNSEDRQLEIAPRVAEAKGWHLRDDLAVQNLGISAYHAKNVDAINEIIRQADAGIIPQGTVMILEALDRFSRLSIDDSYSLLRNVLKAGIEIYTDRTQRHLTKESLKDVAAVMMTVFELDAAFQYSDKLAYRVGRAWNKKRERLVQGEKLTEKTVSWVDGKTWKLIPERVKTVKRIFKMYDDGLGISTICRQLNAEKVLNLGRAKTGWNSGFVWALLHNRAVIGEFQPYKTHVVQGQKSYRRSKIGDAINDYYPRAIDDGLFHSVQAKLGDSKKAMKTGKIVNLFQGVAYCACGEKMNLTASNKKGVVRRYYTCWGKTRGTSCQHSPSVPYQPIESLFMLTVLDNAEKLFPVGEQKNERAGEIRGQIGELKRKIDNITNLVVDGKATKSLVEKQGEFEQQVETLRDELALVESRALARKQSPKIDFSEITLMELSENMNVRRKVQGFILANVSRMVFSIDRKTCQFQFSNEAGGEMVKGKLEALKQPKNMDSTKDRVKEYLSKVQEPLAA